MAPKKKTGVPNVDIGGAYKLAREASVPYVPDAVNQSEATEEDVDAELKALAQAEAEGDQEATAGGTFDDAAPGEEASAMTDNQGDGGVDTEEEDVDAELQALAEETGEDSAKADSDRGNSNNADQTPDSTVGCEAPNEAAEDLPGEDDDEDMTDAEDATPATEADNTDGDAAGDIEAAVTPATQGQDADAMETSANGSLGDTSADATPDASLKSHPVPVERPLGSAGKGASGTASGASTAAAAAAGAVNKGGAEATKPVFKSKKRQLAPVAAAAAPVVIPQSTPGLAAAKATAGSRAGAVMKAVALAANKAAGKFKCTAPQPKAAAAENTIAASAGTPAAAVPSAAKPPTVGKKLVTPVAKATSASNPSAASTPVKAPAKGPAKKAAPTTAEGAPTGEGPAAKGKGKGKASDAEKAPKAPRAKNAYMFFMADRRDAVKAETPGISVGDIAKAIGEMWRGLSEEEKRPFQELADADKDRVAKVKADLPPVAKQPKAAKEPKADKVPRAKTAYLLYCDAKREEIKAANPGASFGETGKLLAAAWKDCPAEDKARFQEQSQSAKMEVQTAAAAATLTAVAAKKQKSAQAAKAPVKPAAPTPSDEIEEEEDLAGEPEAEGGGFATLSEAADTAAGAEAADTAAAHAAAPPTAVQAEGDDESDDEADRENADWDANPAECIIAHTYHSKYMVKRKGLDFTEYGLVDARAAKRQRLSGDCIDPKVPVSLEMVEEYDNFCKDFRRCVHENQDQGNLDLDNIGQGSALEMCYYLGKLQEEHYLLSKPPKRKGEVDIMIKVPMLGVSMVTQRLVNVERKLRLEAEALAAEKAQEAERLKGELTVLQMMATVAQGKQTSVAMEE